MGYIFFTPGSGIAALINSSSAAILATIAFINAGLLTLAQAIGIIFGANPGTTSTAWIAALAGFSIKEIAINTG